MSQITENLNSRHRKNEFSCGKQILDTYLHRQANQDIKRKLSACFVIIDQESNLIKGYYTLSNNSIPQKFIPKKFQKRLPKTYSFIPTTLLGRLAIDIHFQGKGIGKLLLIDALKRSFEISKSIGSFAVIVDPLDKEAEMFYDKYGFIELPDSGKMFLPMKTIKELFE
jgi:predicted GNAT family N-acyltransferase